MSLTSQTTNEKGEYVLNVTISAEDFKKALDTAYHKNNKKISVPGFRKGKTPRAVIEQMYGSDFFFDDALNDILPDAYADAIEAADADVIDRPNVDVKSTDTEKGVEVVFTVAVKPQLMVKKYKGLEAVREQSSVSDEDVDKEIESMQYKASRLVNVEDRAAQKDDTAVIDFEGFVDGKAFEGGKGENFSLVLGSDQFIDNFEDQVIAHKPGDEFDVNVKFPEEYGAKELAGKDATFKVKINELRCREMPELDDEFAKDVSEFETFAELKKDAREKLEKAAAERADADFENQLGDALAEQLEGNVPAVMISNRVDEMVRDFEMRLQSQGLKLADYIKYTGADMDTFRKSFAEQAEKQVKTRLALDAVALSEKIEITAEDIEKEFKEMAEKYELDVEKIKELVSAKDIKGDLAANKALDIVKNGAKVIAAKAKVKKEKTVKKEAAADDKSAAAEK